MKARYSTFITDLQGVVETYGTNAIKTSIGDSVNNNRTVTVNQLIRFLSTRRKPKLRLLGQQLETLYSNPLIRAGVSDVRFLTDRTDAIDLNEFVAAYSNVVLNGTTAARRIVGRQLSAA